MMELPEIPLIDLGVKPVASLIEAAPSRFDDLMQACIRHYGRFALRQGDIFTRYWLAKNRNPYAGDISSIAARVDYPGAYLLNLSYEWSCTSGVAADPTSPRHSRMLRNLDWPLTGLGKNVVVAKVEASAGVYYNVTWPGFAGVLTAMAPGRFSAAINQPPMRRYTPSSYADWAINRVRIWGQTSLPPVHLLRHVFEKCDTYEQAKRVLSESPLCLSAFFTLSGIHADEGCVIERTETRSVISEAPSAISNHWVGLKESGMNRGLDSPGRLSQMQSIKGQAGHDFRWVTPPILNQTTRLSVIASAGQGKLSVQGWESGGPVTAVFEL